MNFRDAVAFQVLINYEALVFQQRAILAKEPRAKG